MKNLSEENFDYVESSICQSIIILQKALTKWMQFYFVKVLRRKENTLTKFYTKFCFDNEIAARLERSSFCKFQRWGKPWEICKKAGVEGVKVAQIKIKKIKPLSNDSYF